MEEVEHLKVVFKGGATDGDPNWRTHYMQAEHGFQRHAPHLVTKILEAMKRVDSEHWRVLEGRDPSQLKVPTHTPTHPAYRIGPHIPNAL